MSIFIISAIATSVIFLTYSYYIYRRYGVLSSVSASTYFLPKDESWKFTLVLWSMGILNLAFIDLIGGWAFLASAGIIFAGVTVDHAEAPAKVPHTVGTVLAIVATFIGIGLTFGLWVPTAIVAAGILSILVGNMSNKIWWIEIWSMVNATISYIIAIK